MELSELRQQIDAIDKELTDLFLKRMVCSAAVGAYKRERGLPVYVPEREQAIIEKLSNEVPAQLQPYVAQLYEKIFALSRAYQNEG